MAYYRRVSAAINGRSMPSRYPSILSFILFMASTSSAQWVIAHRGASYDSPENTLAAFRLAWEQEADGIEADFRLTRDGQIVCIHDEDTLRVSGTKLVVAESTWQQLQELDVGRWKGECWSGERIPTLREVLACIPTGKKLFLELKTGPEIIQPLQRVLAESNFDPTQIVVISFQEATLRECKRLIPEVRCHWLTSFKSQNPQSAGAFAPDSTSVVDTLRICGADGLGCQALQPAFDQNFIHCLRENAIDEFHVWTIDDWPTARYYRRLGARAITTNRPAFIRRGLAAVPPHVILVMADDQGYGDTGFTGHPRLRTPHLDAMAAESVVFHRFYAAAPVCSPTRASVLTGRHPLRGGVPNHGHSLRPDELTVAEALRAAGYVTGHFGKWHLGSVQSDAPTSPGGQGFDHWLSAMNFFDADPFLSREGRFEQLEGEGTVLTMDATLEFLARHQDGGRPMFAVVWFPSPHLPHAEVPNGDVEPYVGPQEGYYREIQLLDHQIGRLRTALREMGIADQTVVWYCSDNGGLNPESSGGRGKKGTVYEGGLRVPSLLEWPGVLEPRAIDVPASTCDIYPTILNFANATVAEQPQLDGIDLAPILAGRLKARPGIGFWHNFAEGRNTPSDELIRQLMEAQQAGEPPPFPDRAPFGSESSSPIPLDRFPGHAAWNAWPWKLHRIESATGGISFELYNLIDDPRESNNRYSAEPERAADLQSQLADWQSSVLRSLTRTKSDSSN